MRAVQDNLRDSDENLASVTYLWSGDMAKLALDQANEAPVGKAACKTIVIKVASYVCLTVNTLCTDVANRLLPANLTKLNVLGITWELTDEQMVALVSALWQAVEENNGLKLLPTFHANNSFPYTDLSGECAIISCYIDI